MALENALKLSVIKERRRRQVFLYHSGDKLRCARAKCLAEGERIRNPKSAVRDFELKSAGSIPPVTAGGNQTIQVFDEWAL